MQVSVCVAEIPWTKDVFISSTFSARNLIQFRVIDKVKKERKKEIK